MVLKLTPRACRDEIHVECCENIYATANWSKRHMRTVDHVNAFQVSEEDANNELVTLECLSVGLAELVKQVKLLEAPMQSYESTNGWGGFSVTGFDFEEYGVPANEQLLLPCYFHWFGTSVCNYARLVGFVAGVGSGVFPRNATEDPRNFELIKKHCDSYVDSITDLEPIKIWRNKVFAHFAITDPRSKDNAALLDVSTMSPMSYSNGRFRVGGAVIMVRGAEIEMPPWSVTESFERLAPRYWPVQTP